VISLNIWPVSSYINAIGINRVIGNESRMHVTIQINEIST